jgi:hypothetical protein
LTAPDPESVDPGATAERRFPLAAAVGLRPSHLSKAGPDGRFRSINLLPIAVKGQKFSAVIFMACDDSALPLDKRVEDAADEAEIDDIYETAGCLSHSAFTQTPV